MTTDFQALLKRIANGETTEADVLAVTSLTHPLMGIDYAAGESKTRIFYAGETFVPLTELEAVKAQAAQDHMEADGYAAVMKERDELKAEAQTLRAQLQDAAKSAGQWKSEYEMFRGAWVRETNGVLRKNKTHLIDELVLLTRGLREKADKWDKSAGLPEEEQLSKRVIEAARGMKRWNDEINSRYGVNEEMSYTLRELTELIDAVSDYDRLAAATAGKGGLQ